MVMFFLAHAISLAGAGAIAWWLATLAPREKVR
jgi:hypothetical protein